MLITSENLGWLFALAVAVAVGLAVYLFGDALYGLALRLWRASRPRWRKQWEKYLATLPGAPSNTRTVRVLNAPRRAAWLRYLPVGGGAILAGVAVGRAPLLALYCLLLGVAIAWYLGRRAESTGSEALTDQVESLVTAFASIYQVTPAVTAALSEAADGVDEPFKGLVKNAVNRGDLRALPDLAATVRNPFFDQFVFILDQAGHADQQALGQALRDLEKRLSGRRRIQNRGKVSLAILGGTVRLLQGANVAAVVAALTVPLWADFYASNLNRQGMFIAVATAIAAASLYFDQEITALRERT